MYRHQIALIINLIMLADGLTVIVGGYVAVYLRWILSGYTWTMDGTILTGMMLFLMFTNNFVMGSLGLYSDKRAPSFFYTLRRLAVAVLIVFSLFSVGLVFLKLQNISRTFLGVYAAIVFLGFVISRLIMEAALSRIRTRGFNTLKILIVGVGERAEAMFKALMAQRSWGHEVVGLIKPDDKGYIICKQAPCLGMLGDLNALFKEKSVDEVIFALEPDCTTNIKGALDLCEKTGITYKIVPALYDTGSLHRIQVEHIQGIPTISKYMISINAAGMFYKRIVDFCFGLAGTVAFCLMYPFVALIIKLDSPGPVMFMQKRVGQNGRLFNIYKFRTMYMDAEARKRDLMRKNQMQGLMFKMENDPRITRMGRFLRKTSLDEVPQFINVLKGEMSLVGTRPPTLDEVNQYEAWHRRRISMKPGITGMWQVSGRNKINDFNQVVRLDLHYIDHWHFLTDIKIILQTIWVVLRRKGAF